MPLAAQLGTPGLLTWSVTSEELVPPRSGAVDGCSTSIAGAAGTAAAAAARKHAAGAEAAAAVAAAAAAAPAAAEEPPQLSVVDRIAAPAAFLHQVLV